MPDQWGATPHDFKHYDLKQRMLEADKFNRLEGARNGEYRWVKLALNIAAESLRVTNQLRPELAKYVADVIEKIADGKDLNKGFGIIKRRPGSREKREYLAMSRAHKVEILRELDGLTLDAAVSAVSESDHASFDTIKLAWKKHHREAKRLIKFEKEVLGNVIRI